MADGIGVGDDQLALAVPLGVALLGEVAECARQRQVAVHAVVLDPAARALNALALRVVFGLVVLGQGDRQPALAACHRPRVASVGYLQHSVFDQTHVGSAPPSVSRV